MDHISYKTISASKETADKQWIVVDAQGQRLGRMASKVAKLLRGKHKPNFTPHADCGDNVIVLNASHIELTGNKATDRSYVRHTGYPGGQRFTTTGELMAKSPSRLIETSIRGMLPKNRLGRELFRNLYVYDGTTHKHEGQQPKSINLNEFK